MRARGVEAAREPYASGTIEVSYERGMFLAHRAAAMRELSDADAAPAGEIDFANLDRVTEIVHVAPGEEDRAIARLRSDILVRDVSRAAIRYKLSTNAASAFPNDPYFDGFAPENGPPLYEAPDSAGQWDMHVICAANAWAYGKANSTGMTHAGALGGTAPIAIIDTGADSTHPDLQGRIVYAESDLSGVTNVGSADDGDGHGTDVAGIAAAAGNNRFGFAGVAYAAPLMIFKVFPDPPCASGGCNAFGTDIAIAIQHAISHGAKVINLSLGSSGVDTAEENAVASAIKAGIVVVASAGNEQASRLDYPAAYPGVLAVGASALDDSSGVVKETVASYSNYDGSNPMSWGIVAPGGDPAGSSDSDLLHWIENIYTSQSSNSSGFCTADGNDGGRVDCRVLIAGTSQAAPHAAGAASLLLSVGAHASAIKNLLCSTATPIAGIKSGCGRLNVYRAMASAVGDLSP